MNDNELDQMLSRWKTPEPSPGLRARVLDEYPRQPRRSFWRPLRWAAAMAALLCMLALGTEQGAMDNFAAGVRQFSEGVNQWFDQMWIGHIVMAFRNSDLKVYVDGEQRSDVVIGGKHGGLWVQFPGEGRYYLALHLHGFKAYVPGRFDGHALEFQADGRAVRVESRRTYGFGGQRQVFLLGPARPGQ